MCLFSLLTIRSKLGISLLIIIFQVTAVQCAVSLHSSEMLRAVDWQQVTDVLAQPRRKSWTERPLKMGSISCSETSVANYQYALYNIVEGQGLQLYCCGSLKFHIRYISITYVLQACYMISPVLELITLTFHEERNF